MSYRDGNRSEPNRGFIGRLRSSLGLVMFVLVAINDFKQPAGWVFGCLQLQRIMWPHGNWYLVTVSDWNKPAKHHL
jgi:hypothetical protein